ncbi:TPA: hypothetical protein ACTZ3T_002825 [Bacillus cereus]|uniref:hypothetical protein n=1 Tax=Bacillus cereus TaxID=1396 RepID=UPI003016A75B
MYKKEKNPFDRGIPSETNPILIVLHTEFFSENYQKLSIEIQKLIDISKLPFVTLMLLPARNISTGLGELIQKENVLIGAYVDTNRFQEMVALSHKGKEEGILNGNLAKWGEVNAGDSKVRVLDLQAINHIEPDYFVMSKEDTFYEKQSISAKKITINDLLQELRVLLVHYSIFYDRPNSRIIGENPYYSYRVRIKFPQFIESSIKWNPISSEKTSINPSSFGSLHQRLYLISKALDKIDFHSLRNANNDTLDECLYHLGYMIMLVTGAFDGIAWIIKNFHEIDLPKMKVSIQVPIGKQNTELLKKLKSYNIELCDYLLDKKTQNNINIIYQIRHSLQHRTFIQGMGQVTSEKRESNLLFLPHESPDLFEDKGITNSDVWGFKFRLDEGKLFDLCTFTHRVFEVTCEIVNNTLSLLNWEIPLRSLTGEDRKMLEEKLIEFRQFKSYYDRTGKDSMYFN